MTDTKHTPTPWRIEDGTTLIWGNCNTDDNTDAGMGYPITECRITPISASSWCKAPYNEEGEANAVHIVKCVNLHDELVEAIKEIRGIICEAAPDGFNPLIGDWVERLYLTNARTHAALKKAGAL